MSTPETPANASIIKVIGVGGGGSNAANYMFNMGVEGVDFIVCNTDSQALVLSPIQNKIQLGPHLTQGLGAGANPDIGMQASEESTDDISKMLKVGTKMAFVTAGMGGGTGTGGAPVVARLCRDLGILTVGIVTTPFTHEGPKRMKQAKEGIDRLREHVDTILIISNDKLRQQFGSFKFTEAFSKADDVLATATKCITEVITSAGRANLDFADVTTVMKNGGVAILGHAAAAGENRALVAVENALNSPLLNDSDIKGAKWILLNITSAQGDNEHTLDEIDEISAYVQSMAGENCDVILGMGHDEALGENIAVTLIATGFHHKEVSYDKPAAVPEKEQRRVLGVLDMKADAAMPFASEERSGVLPSATALENASEAAMAAQTPPPVAIPVTPSASALGIKLVSRPAEAASSPVAEGDKKTTEEEEQRVFEAQKAALEERAERLRRLSFNAKGGSTDDIENVPAYLRRSASAEEDMEGKDGRSYSGYTVGFGDSKNPEGTANLNSINTFLEGKKPD